MSVGLWMCHDGCRWRRSEIQLSECKRHFRWRRTVKRRDTIVGPTQVVLPAQVNTELHLRPT